MSPPCNTRMRNMVKPGNVNLSKRGAHASRSLGERILRTESSRFEPLNGRERSAEPRLGQFLARVGNEPRRRRRQTLRPWRLGLLSEYTRRGLQSGGSICLCCCVLMALLRYW